MSRVVILLLACALACACSVANAKPKRAARPAPKPAHTSPLGTNLAPLVDWGTERPFVDLMKQSRAWMSTNGVSWEDTTKKIAVDTNGWVTKLEPGQFARTLVAWDTDVPAGDYVVTWKGTGVIDLFPQTPTSMSEHRATFTVSDVAGGDRRGIAVTIKSTSPSDPVRDIRVTRAADEKSSATFTAEFLESVKPFSVLRFMDWMHTNDATTFEKWADRPEPADARYTVNGVPLEVMIELANTTGADPWITIGHTWSDDAVRAAAQLVKDRLDKKLHVWVEHSNEVWNDMFPQAQHAKGRGGALSQDIYQGRLRYHSQRTVAIMKIFEDVFGAETATRVVRVMGSMAVNAWTSGELLEWQDAAAHIDALAIAPYFGGQLGEPEQAAQTRVAEPKEMAAALEKAIATSAGWVREHKKVADQHGVALVAYEGGQHMVGVGSVMNDEQLAHVLMRTNADAAMKPLYLKYLAAWKDAGGTLFVHYTSTMTPTKFGAWGARADIRQTRAQAPKWDALLTFVEQTPRWW